MTVLTTPPPAAAPLAAAPPAARHTIDAPLYRLTVAQFQAMVRHGILTEDDRVELLHGLIVEKMPLSPPHSFFVTKLMLKFVRLLPDDLHARQEQSIDLTPLGSQPEPDLAVIRGSLETYQDQHPAPPDIVLLIEVSDTTRRRDDEKAALYAAAGVPLYVIVDIQKRELVQHTSPNGDAYTEVRTVESFDVRIDEMTLGCITRDDLFPALTETPA